MATRTATILAGMALTLLLAACGGGSTTPAATTTASPTSTSASAVTTTTARPTTVPPTTVSDDTAAITQAFVTFFNGKDRDLDKKLALLENGEKYRTMVADAMANPQYQQMSTQIRSVRVLRGGACTAVAASDPCAVVVHDVLVGGFPAVAAHESPAVRQGGIWKVGAKAWCDFVAIGGETCPA